MSQVAMLCLSALQIQTRSSQIQTMSGGSSGNLALYQMAPNSDDLAMCHLSETIAPLSMITCLWAKHSLLASTVDGL